ncbi:MAG: YqaA family protein [Gallionellaceae bacterium]|jgi:membrane protein YqaA with SNARE-associated domain
MMDFFTSDLSLWGLFLSSFLSATILPGGSELVLIGVIKLHPELLWPAVAIGTVGNTLGAMATFAMGWFLPLKHELKHADKIIRYGTPALLLSWLPLIGDALCLAAGFLRMNPWYSLLFIAIGKYARYAIIALTLQ